MFRFFIKFFSFLILILITLILYLSFFGIQTNKFNNQIKSEILKQDKRFDIDLSDVFIKLNIKEMSISLNSQNIIFFIGDYEQKIKNLNIFIDLVSFIKRDNRINKITINSKENDIKKLLKFINAYKINIPALFLEKNIIKGEIIYNIDIDNNRDNQKFIISGKILDAKLNILDRGKIEDIYIDFEFKDNLIDINRLDLKYENTKFSSEKIYANINKNVVFIKGNFQNNINYNLASYLFKKNFLNYFDEAFLLNSESNFEILLDKGFKIKDYNIKSKIKFNDININFKNFNLNKFEKNFKNHIKFTNGNINLSFNKKK